MPATDQTLAWLTGSDPLDVFAWVSGTVMLVIALAQWLASYRADKRALRIFALRYLASALGWWFAHPGRQQSGQAIPLGSAFVGVALLAVTVWALDEFLGSASVRRRWAIAAGALGAALLIALYRQWQPSDPVAIYAAMAGSMALCAGMAWAASRREAGVGHAYVAAAFALYPVVMLAAAIWVGWHARSNLAYLVALPTMIVGITVLVVSLLRAARRTEAALRLHEVAEARLAELNTTLERRVDERTAELTVMVEGLESFARAVSHDLRGSLGGAAGVSRLAEQALSRGDTALAKRLLQAVTPQLEHLASLVRDLLTLTRLGDAALNRQPQPLAQLVRQALEQLALEPDHADRLREVAVEVGELPSAAVDATLFRQVFVNLLANALRFAAGGERAPVVRVGYAAPRAGEPPAVYVEDNGPGFAPEAAGRLFQPFGRLHEGTLSQHGIGLSIVRRIIERHGGRIWADGRPGQGAVFWFALPGC